jgi:hypothetical protein
MSVPASYVTNVVSGGDIDGDGYGDFLLGFTTSTDVAFGSPSDATEPPRVTIPDARKPKPARPVIAAGFDANADGLGDVLLALPTLDTDPQLAFFGDRTRTLGHSTSLAADAPVVAAVAGDFDGDGISEVAAISNDRVCLWKNGSASLALCSAADTGALRSLVAVDLEGDGQDDVVAAIETEGNPVAFAAFHLKPSAFEASSIDTGQTDLTRRMTTIWPGRPGPGRWAVAASDHIVIFEGTKVLQKLGPSPLLPLTYRGLR